MAVRRIGEVAVTPQTGATQTSTPQTPPTFEAMAAFLERRGWLRSVCADRAGLKDGKPFDDFSAAVNALCAMRATPSKGLIVSGEYGCGKTSLVKAYTGYSSCDNFFDMNDRMARERIDPHGGFGETYYDLFTHSVVIDDLGAELRNNYGETDYSEARDFICEYHTRYRGRGRLFITTNLRLQEILDRYGGRLVDRLKDLCVPLRLYGRSKREWVLP